MEQSNTSLRERARKAHEEVEATSARRNAEGEQRLRENASDRLTAAMKELGVEASDVRTSLENGSALARVVVEGLAFQWEAASSYEGRVYLIGTCPECGREYPCGRVDGVDPLDKLHRAIEVLDGVEVFGHPCPHCVEDEREEAAREEAKDAPPPDRNPTLAEQLEALIVRIVRRELREASEAQ